MLKYPMMDWSVVLTVFRALIATAGLVLIGRLTFARHAYLSTRAYVFFAMAALSFLGVAYWGFIHLSDPASGLAVTHVLETLYAIGIVGGLWEHMHADRQRLKDSQKLMEQRRLAFNVAQKRAQELEILAHITRELTSSLNLREVLQAVVDRALQLGEADAVAVFVPNKETGELTDFYLTSGAGDRAGPQPTPRPNGLTASVARTGEAAFISDAPHHPLYEDGLYPDLRSIASLPLRLEEEIVGVLNISYFRPHRFDDEEKHLLSTFADTAALAVHNAVLHERIATLAVTDELTGLANRRRFLQSVRAELQRARRYQRPLTMLMADLDQLKQINDQNGHAAGDAMLRGVAQCLRSCVRDTDVPARLGGDEFAVLLPETDRNHALTIAERIRLAVEDFRAAINGAEIHSTVSIGVVSRDGGDLPDLPTFIHLADDALYRSKLMGRNAVTALEAPPAPPG